MIQNSPVVSEPAPLHAAPAISAPSAEAALRSSMAQALILYKIGTLSALSIPELVFGLISSSSPCTKTLARAGRA